jgi:hypothetical protein
MRAAEFELAEERGRVVEVEIPFSAAPDGRAGSGLIGSEMIEPLARAYIARMRADQERHPLPARGGLTTLLRQTPVVWLNAISQALDLGDTQTAHRKERERLIANRLLDREFLRRLLVTSLRDDERQLLAYLGERRGKVSAAAVTRRFGSDRDDGWFWNEEPPTSVLGRVRMHGLAFVGAAAEGRGTRTVLVPRELMDPLAEALAALPGAVREDRAGEGASRSHMRADVKKALKRAFPHGLIEPAWDDDDIDAVQTELSRELARIPGAQLLYERTVDGRERWRPDARSAPGARTAWAGEPYDAEDAWDEDLPDYASGWDDVERSYGVLFLSPDGEEFVFAIDAEVIDESGEPRSVAGHGRVGHAIAVSAVASFALLRITSLDSEGECGISSPDIESRYFDDSGRPQREDLFLLDGLGQDAKDRLEDLRQRIVQVLEGSGIAVLLEEDVRQPVPWLEAGEGVLASVAKGQSLTVEDALFFRYL